jgi:hypothetical protein
MWAPYIALFYLGALVAVGRGIYPEVSIAMGGGQPQDALFQFNKEGEDVFLYIDSRLNYKRSEPGKPGSPDDRDAPNPKYRQIKVRIIHSGTDNYVIGFDSCTRNAEGQSVIKKEQIIIDRKIISSIQPLNDGILDPCKGLRDGPYPNLPSWAQ